MATKRAPIAQPTIKHVIGPDGRHLTLADLPSADTKRWVIRRKAAVVAAVRGGLLSLEEACSRYRLSPDEVLCWQHCIDHFGLAGLRTTRSQLYCAPDQRPLVMPSLRQAGASPPYEWSGPGQRPGVAFRDSSLGSWRS
jgi:Protein of unknown function (DUF1153)